MFRLFSFLASLAAIIIGVGFYLGWFSVTPTGKNADGSSTYSVSINKSKIREDLKKGKEEVKQVLGSARSDAAKTTEAAVR